jgi:nucleoside-diphosphate-sugar epimerase
MRPELDCQAINVGGAEPDTVNHLLGMVADAFGARPEVIYLPDRPREVKNAYCTWQKSEVLLGYEERYGVAEGVRRMAAWAKGLGPQRWCEEKLELPSEKAPHIWLETSPEAASGKP